MFQPGSENPIAGAYFERIGVEQVLRHIEQAQAFGARTGALRSGQHEVEDVLGGIAHVPTGYESLDALDVPSAVGLLDGLGAARSDVGSGVGFGEHHGGLPTTLHTHCRPAPLLFVALDEKRLSQERAEVEEIRGGVGADDHFVDPPGQRRRRGHATDVFGQAQPPPPGLLDRLHRLGQFVWHVERVLSRIEDRRVAVGEGERFGDRAFGQASGFGQDRSDGILVEVAVASGAEDGALHRERRTG